MLFRLAVIVVPFLQCGFPIGVGVLRSGVGSGFGLAGQAFGFAFLSTPFLHRRNGGVVQNLDGTALNGSIEFLVAEGLSLHIEVGDIKFKLDAQVVANHLLLESCASILLAKQSRNDVNLAL